MVTNQEEDRQSGMAELNLWQKLISELNDESVAYLPDNEQLQRQIRLMKRLVKGLAPKDRKLITLYCHGVPYAKIRQEPEFRKVKIPTLRRLVCNLVTRLTEQYARLKRTCNKFELDLTDYIARQREYLPFARQQTLVEHILKCPNCRRDFQDRQDVLTLTVMQARPPEDKTKMRAFIKRLIAEAGNKDKNKENGAH